jgi:hypothetical protein
MYIIDYGCFINPLILKITSFMIAATRRNGSASIALMKYRNTRFLEG